MHHAKVTSWIFFYTSLGITQNIQAGEVPCNCWIPLSFMVLMALINAWSCHSWFQTDNRSQPPEYPTRTSSLASSPDRCFPDLIFFMTRESFTAVRYLDIRVYDWSQRFLHNPDLQPANILVSKKSENTAVEFLQEPEKSKVIWLEGIERDNPAPDYLLVSQRPWGLLSDITHSELILKLGDLGGGEYVSPEVYDRMLILRS